MPFCVPHETGGGPCNSSKARFFGTYWSNSSKPDESNEVAVVQWHRVENAPLVHHMLREQMRATRFANGDINVDAYRIVLRASPYYCIATSDSYDDIRHDMQVLVRHILPQAREAANGNVSATATTATTTTDSPTATTTSTTTTATTATTAHSSLSSKLVESILREVTMRVLNTSQNQVLIMFQSYVGIDKLLMDAKASSDAVIEAANFKKQKPTENDDDTASLSSSSKSAASLSAKTVFMTEVTEIQHADAKNNVAMLEQLIGKYRAWLDKHTQPGHGPPSWWSPLHPVAVLLQLATQKLQHLRRNSDVACIRCKIVLRANAKFCDQCGNPQLQESASDPLPPPPPPPPPGEIPNVHRPPVTSPRRPSWPPPPTVQEEANGGSEVPDMATLFSNVMKKELVRRRLLSVMSSVELNAKQTAYKAQFNHVEARRRTLSADYECAILQIIAAAEPSLRHEEGDDR